jgi:hypothetical protein
LQRSELARGIDDLLEVVEQQQQLLAAKLVLELGLRTDRRRDRRDDERRIADRREPDPPDSVAEVFDCLGGDLEREPRLADSAGTRDCHKASAAAKQPEHVGKLLLAADQWVGRKRQVAVVQTLERRKVAFADLVDPLGRGEVLQPMLSQIAQPVCTDKVSG